MLLFPVYLGIGLLFGVFFAVKGVELMDPVAKGSPVTFRVLTIPAAVALWPFLLFKLKRNQRVAA